MFKVAASFFSLSWASSLEALQLQWNQVKNSNSMWHNWPFTWITLYRFPIFVVSALFKIFYNTLLYPFWAIGSALHSLELSFRIPLWRKLADLNHRHDTPFNRTNQSLCLCLKWASSLVTFVALQPKKIPHILYITICLHFCPNTTP